ncbi:MAG: SIMPL domain-containing protein [bacterium]|nr:SIMPL domain-containing protein [bacterium]
MENNSAKFKNIAIAVFMVFLMSVITYSFFWGPAKKFGDSLFPTRTFLVSAEGKVMVSPDIAKISFSVISEGINPKTIAEENNKKMNSAIDFIKSQGIDEKDIKTTQYNLSPRYEYDEKTKKTFISGYTLTQNVLVKIRDLSKVAEVLGGLPELGINQIGQVSFEIDEPEKYLAEARDKAFDKANIKAKEMSGKNNVQLGRVINFLEWGSTPRPYYENLRALGMGGEAAAPQALPQIQPGTEEVIVQVNITYEIK